MCNKLTKKSIEAITEYALIKSKDLPITYYMVRHILAADRMQRDELYKFLQRKGYKWKPRAGVWIKPKVV